MIKQYTIKILTEAILSLILHKHCQTFMLSAYSEVHVTAIQGLPFTIWTITNPTKTWTSWLTWYLT